MFEWYNAKICEDKCWEFEEKYSFTYSSILNALHSGFEDFCLACNVLAHYGYLPERKIKNLNYKEKNELVKIANKIAREKAGEIFTTLFDGIVEKKGEELWGGDEFYELFAYDLPPYYVRSCAKAAIYIMDMMNNPKTAKETLRISSMCCHTPYWDLYEENISEKNINRQNMIREKECKGWRRIAKDVYEQNFDDAYAFISECDNVRRIV